jgi:hypothetical protein
VAILPCFAVKQCAIYKTGIRGIFIKLGQKHASKGQVELAVFEIFGEGRFGVRDLGLLLAVAGFDLLLRVPYSVYFVGYGTTQASNISIHVSDRARGGGSEWRGGIYKP